MFRLTGAIAGAAALLVLTAAGSAAAHAHLVSSTPPADATVASPEVITVRFSEALEAKFSGLDVKGSTGAAVNGAALSLPGQTKSLSLALTSALAPGKYTVNWHAVSTDGHRTKGAFAFTVK
jgi:methionine-rich copper-binding protein CopC